MKRLCIVLQEASFIKFPLFYQFVGCRSVSPKDVPWRTTEQVWLLVGWVLRYCSTKQSQEDIYLSMVPTIMAATNSYKSVTHPAK